MHCINLTLVAVMMFQMFRRLLNLMCMTMLRGNVVVERCVFVCMVMTGSVRWDVVPWPTWNLAKLDSFVQSCWLSRSHMQMSWTSKSSLQTNTNKRVRADTRQSVVDVGRMHKHLVSSVTSRHLDELRVHETHDVRHCALLFHCTLKSEGLWNARSVRQSPFGFGCRQ